MSSKSLWLFFLEVANDVPSITGSELSVIEEIVLYPSEFGKLCATAYLGSFEVLLGIETLDVSPTDSGVIAFGFPSSTDR